jgi:hypothetical protein
MQNLDIFIKDIPTILITQEITRDLGTQEFEMTQKYGPFVSGGSTIEQKYI